MTADRIGARLGAALVAVLAVHVAAHVIAAAAGVSYMDVWRALFHLAGFLLGLLILLGLGFQLFRR